MGKINLQSFLEYLDQGTVTNDYRGLLAVTIPSLYLVITHPPERLNHIDLQAPLNYHNLSLFYIDQRVIPYHFCPG